MPPLATVSWALAPRSSPAVKRAQGSPVASRRGSQPGEGDVMTNTMDHTMGEPLSTDLVNGPVEPTPHANGVPAAHGAAATPFARDLLGALQRFRDGEFGSRMPSDLVGVEGKIADLFNEILAVSLRRATETARVCRVVGKEGKLKERMRVPGAVGGWADEISALNTLIDDLVWPTTEV